jgi:D-alanyl-D-alanine dipeptidase
LDIRYAADDNAFKTALYPFPAAFLAEPAALKLARAAEALKGRGYRLSVLDAYRPLRVQRRMWALRPDARYVADPAKGSSHNRGSAVDVSLARLDGGAVAMPSDFDDFSERAAHDFPGALPEAARNAGLLKSAMVAAGFAALAAEWWHYSDPDLRGLPLLDIPFEDLPTL